MSTLFGDPLLTFQRPYQTGRCAVLVLPCICLRTHLYVKRHASHEKAALVSWGYGKSYAMAGTMYREGNRIRTL
jgi:hypothetical protein